MQTGDKDRTGTGGETEICKTEEGKTRDNYRKLGMEAKAD